MDEINKIKTLNGIRKNLIVLISKNGIESLMCRRITDEMNNNIGCFKPTTAWHIGSAVKGIEGEVKSEIIRAFKDAEDAAENILVVAARGQLMRIETELKSLGFELEPAE